MCYVGFGIELVTALTLASEVKGHKISRMTGLRYFSFITVIVTSLGVLAYVVFKARYFKSCSLDKKECPKGMVQNCDQGTGWDWKCVKDLSGCSPDKQIHCKDGDDTCDAKTQTCKYGDPSCNAALHTWECPRGACPDDWKHAPVQCPPLKAGPETDFELRCDSGTGFKVGCVPKCWTQNEAKSKSLLPSCGSGQHLGCDASTKNEWACFNADSDVCGTGVKPTDCEAPICFDSVTADGWVWKCPGELSREDLINLRGYSAQNFRNADTGKDVEIVFSQQGIPIAPTVGMDCPDAGKTASQALPSDEEAIINNPNGHIHLDPKTTYGKKWKEIQQGTSTVTDEGLCSQPGMGTYSPGLVWTLPSVYKHGNWAKDSVVKCTDAQDKTRLFTPVEDDAFFPYDASKRIYYKPSSDNQRVCLLSTDLSHDGLCENGGTWHANQPFSSSGACKCVGDYELPLCKYSPSKDCSGNGTVDGTTGVCTCTGDFSPTGVSNSPPRTPAPCSQHACNSKGVLKDGKCTCSAGWVDSFTKDGLVPCSAPADAGCWNLSASCDAGLAGICNGTCQTPCANVNVSTGTCSSLPEPDPGFPGASGGDCQDSYCYCFGGGGQSGRILNEDTANSMAAAAKSKMTFTGD
jgi:hypothetical protein